jgi:hypothetical protein
MSPSPSFFRTCPPSDVTAAEASFEIGVDEVAPVLGVELRSEARRSDKIAEHHRDRPALG